MIDLSNLTDAELDHAMCERALAEVKEKAAKQLFSAADALDASSDALSAVRGELTALRKLRDAVGKMVMYDCKFPGKRAIHPRDWQQVSLFLTEAQKAECRHVRTDTHV